MKERTQIYLTSEEKKKLSELSAKTGKTQSELIRNAIDKYVEIPEGQSREEIIDATFGAWLSKSKKEIQDIRELRSGWDRKL